MHRKWIPFVAILVIASAYFSWRKVSETPQALQDNHVATGTSAGDLEETPTSSSAAPVTFTSEPVSEKRTKAFQDWFQKEAQEIEKSSGDPQVQEERLKKIAQELNPSEIQVLKEALLAENTSANSSILSMYLLTLAPKASEALEEVIKAPLKYDVDQPVHSPEETLSMQERSLRRMALDALFNRAEADSDQRERLRRVIAEIPDKSLREYAEKRLKSLN